MKKLLLLILAVFTVSSMMAQFTVTFSVDMTEAEDFDPLTENVYISGDLVSWTTPGENPDYMLMPDIDDPMMYSISFDFPEGDTVVNFKYFIVMDEPTWDNGEWDGDPNRRAALKGETTLMHTWGNQPYFVNFFVDMSPMADFYPDTMHVYMAGSFADWPQPGNVAELMMMPTDTNDMYYTLTWPIYEGDVEYKYFLVYESETASWDHGEWEGGDNRMLTVDTTMDVMDVWSVINASINDINAGFEMSIYPNPVETTLTIELAENNRKIEKVEIYSIAGTLVRSVEGQSESLIDINVNDLSKGAYFISVYSENGVQTNKLIKE